MKKILSLLFLSTLILGSLHAESFVDAGYHYYTLTDETVALTYCESPSRNFSIPTSAYYKNKVYKVTEIAESAFQSNSYIESVSIPSTITLIGKDAFSGCGNLSEISFPETPISVGYNCFNYCKSLKNIELKENTSFEGPAFSHTPLETVIINCKNVPSRFLINSTVNKVTFGNSVTSIGEYAFSGCGKLEEIELPNSLTSIGEFVFYNCLNLKEVVFPPSFLSIPEGAFYNCFNLSKILIPSSIDTIGRTAFWNCWSISSIEIQGSVNSIESEAFQRCASLTSLEIQGSVNLIGIQAFEGCENLISVEIPSVNFIASNAFSNCKALEYISLNCEEIGDKSFEYCFSLKEITFKDRVKDIKYGAFKDCPNISEIKCYATTPPSAWKGSFPEKTYKNASLYVLPECKRRYESTSPWDQFLNIMGSLDGAGVESIVDSQNLEIKIDGDVLYINGVQNQMKYVFDTAGKVVYKGIDSEIRNLPKGYYIVKVGKETRKITL